MSKKLEHWEEGDKNVVNKIFGGIKSGSSLKLTFALHEVGDDGENGYLEGYHY